MLIQSKNTSLFVTPLCNRGLAFLSFTLVPDGVAVGLPDGGCYYRFFFSILLKLLNFNSTILHLIDICMLSNLASHTLYVWCDPFEAANHNHKSAYFLSKKYCDSPFLEYRIERHNHDYNTIYPMNYCKCSAGLAKHLINDSCTYIFRTR